MEIRQEQAADRAAVRRLHVDAFGGDHGRLVADLVDALGPETELSLVATHASRVVGHVLFSRSVLDAPRRLVDVQVLSPVGVDPAHQRQGIATALIETGLETLSARSVPVVFLEGAPGFYSRFGFRPGADLGFRKPSLRIPDAAFQARPLPSYEPWMTGTLVYAHAFWEHDAVGLRDHVEE